MKLHTPNTGEMLVLTRVQALVSLIMLSSVSDYHETGWSALANPVRDDLIESCCLSLRNDITLVSLVSPTCYTDSSNSLGL